MVEKRRSIAGGALVAGALALILASGAQKTAAQTSDAQPEKPAELVYKNIQVLKGMPASQLLDGMRYITVALGVDCSFCHVRPFESDAKPEKQTARRMMQMTLAINSGNFNGRKMVSCYTCHQGHPNPVSIPALPLAAFPAPLAPAASAAAAPAAPLPTAETLIGRFAAALGGQAAMAKITSRVIQARQVGDDKSSHPQEIYQKAPGKALVVTTFPRGTFFSGFDGTNYWSASSRGRGPVSELGSITIRRDAQFDPAAALASYKWKKVVGREKLGDRDVYVMHAKAPDGVAETLYFDADSGLLLRRSILYSTFFGSLPLQMDYSDYRAVDGVQVPFLTTWWLANGSWSRQVQEVQDNVPLDDSKFEPPATSPQTPGQ